ncbi:cysteine hydrolase family protein [Vreelandella malpeensis]|uniref:Cysteine hydrolase n=1 Tax=Vreelandella malpeensis TaxID=1172368 RepID=A0ABS8DT12_9GAMM|nr:isochorismatase family cysteine hydrolase [Halomonas malpeensis]MCB8888995.1 cysteine hydrolase [Halomonas malpeensis]
MTARPSSQTFLMDPVSLAKEIPPPLLSTLPALPRPITLDLARSALLVVDMQNDFCHPDGWFASNGIDIAYSQAITSSVAGVIESARACEVPVIHLHWGVRADTHELSSAQVMFGRQFGQRPGYGEATPAGHPVLVRGGWGAQAIDALAPLPGDIVVYKSRFSGFWHTELDAILRRLDITTLLFAGINTERCVLATLQDASFLGYHTVVMEDAVATPSPAASEAAFTLIRMLYGFTASGQTLMP